MWRWMAGRRSVACGGITVAAFLLAGCEGKVTVDLAAERPANPDLAQVDVGLTGLEFRKREGGLERLEFRSSEAADLMDATAGTPLRLFTSEELPEGRYSGVRLIFDDKAETRVVTIAGAEFPLALEEGAYAEVDFTVDDDDSSRASLTLTLDLRRSLAFDAAANDYTLTPALRSVPTGAAGQISGAVTATCPTGGTLARGGAVYLFQGQNVTPDDLDGRAPEPFASARVLTETSTGALVYTVRFLPAGDYTLALTCRGDEDDPATDDSLAFRNVTNVKLERAARLTRNLADP